MTSKSEWLPVKTTLPNHPLPPNSSRPAVTTDRLIIRALVPDDVHAWHVLRTQPEVMANTPQGRIDKDLDETRSRLSHYLPPNDEKTFEFAICLKESGEMIGVGGCHSLSSLFGWPAIGYMLRKEYWGKGLATELVRAWLSMWCGLPRTEAEFDADPNSIRSDHGGGERIAETVTAFTTADNIASQKVLEKSGFQRFLTWREPDLRNPDDEIVLRGYRFYAASHAAGKGRRDIVDVA